MTRCEKVHHVVHSNVPRDWFETNSRHPKRYSESDKKVLGCRGLLGRVVMLSPSCLVCSHISYPSYTIGCITPTSLKISSTSLSLRFSIRNAGLSCKSISPSLPLSTFSVLDAVFSVLADCRPSETNDWTCGFVSHSSLSIRVSGRSQDLPSFHPFARQHLNRSLNHLTSWEYNRSGRVIIWRTRKKGLADTSRTPRVFLSPPHLTITTRFSLCPCDSFDRAFFCNLLIFILAQTCYNTQSTWLTMT